MSDAAAVGVQPDLFGEHDAQEERERFLAEWRESLTLDCCTGEPLPLDAMGQPQVRCGRCGEVTRWFLMHTNHDLGWTGCPKDWHDEDGNYTGLYQFKSAEEMSANRHDNLHHAPCARCGHAWGIHTERWGVVPPEEAHCYAFCGCEGYVRPKGVGDGE